MPTDSPDTVNPRRVSPSRIGTYADCGEKFRFKYVERRAEERNSTAQLFGSVMHAAREPWVLDRSQNMRGLVEQAWHDVTKDEPVIRAFLNEYLSMSEKVDATLAAIGAQWSAANGGKESKNARATKLWKEHPVKLALDEMIASWAPKLDESRYTFTENDPLPALYNESLTLADSYQSRWCRLPNALVSELPFDFEWRGFRIQGYIDDISPLVDRDTGELLGHAVIDAKTYKAEGHEFKDWRQLTMYRIAYKHLAVNGMLPFEPHARVYVGIDKMRLLSRDFFMLGEDDERRLLRELQMYERAIENEIYIPASKTCMASRCDFAEICTHYHGDGAIPVSINA